MMAELRTEYVASMPEKIIEIKKLSGVGDAAGVSASPVTNSACDAAALREIFHKLKGSGKTYGLPEVSELFEVCEKLCLNKPQLAQQTAILALELFSAIYEARKTGQPYTVADKPAFKKLCAM